MPPARLRAYSACVFSTAVAAVFFLLAVFPVPVPHYFPLLRGWGLAPQAGELSMDYYGRSLVALIAGLLAALLCSLILRRFPPTEGREGRARGLYLCMAYVATANLLCISLYAYKLFTRPPAPEPIPAWYVPK